LIPTSFDLDHPDFQYYQDTRRNLERIRNESKSYEKWVAEVVGFWMQRENYAMLSAKNRRILKMSHSNFHLTLPEYDDVVDFHYCCKADRAAWRMEHLVEPTVTN
jgi:hypothetical protein